MITWLKDKAVAAIETVVMPSDHPTVVARKAECASCPQQYHIPVVSRAVGPQCLMCGCLIDAKTRTIRERCPLGYW
jgi:hypothetical protein